jgi:hypothetical protein
VEDSGQSYRYFHTVHATAHKLAKLVKAAI